MAWDDDKKKGFGRRWGDEPAQNTEAGGQPQPESNSTQIDELISRATPMVEQINSLYNMFSTGIERLPPNEKRKQLEALIIQLQNTPKPNQTYNFRASSLITHYTSMREKWDRIMRDVESGKIKRTAGPKR